MIEHILEGRAIDFSVLFRGVQDTKFEIGVSVASRRQRRCDQWASWLAASLLAGVGADLPHPVGAVGC
jgi:hypothetical protein